MHIRGKVRTNCRSRRRKKKKLKFCSTDGRKISENFKECWRNSHRRLDRAASSTCAARAGARGGKPLLSRRCDKIRMGMIKLDTCRRAAGGGIHPPQRHLLALHVAQSHKRAEKKKTRRTRASYEGGQTHPIQACKESREKTSNHPETNSRASFRFIGFKLCCVMSW